MAYRVFFFVTFQKQRTRGGRLAKFVVIAGSATAAIKDEWISCDPDFQAEYSFQSGHAKEMKKGVCRVL